jgi:gliding motility-associated-like protein
MRIEKLLIYFAVILYAPLALAQNEWSNWYFSRNSAISFPNRGLPQPKIDFITNPGNESYYYSFYGGISYSDPVTGEMKFVLSGSHAYDKNYNIIPQSYNLRVCPGDFNAFHIIPFNDNSNRFYVIQYQDLLADLLATGGLQVRCPNAIGLGYSILDLNLRGGLGDFTSMNRVLASGIPQGICLVRHANGKDTWVVVHGWNNNNFLAYLFTDNGVTGPVVSSAGPVLSKDNNFFGGTMGASHKGDHIATQMTNTPDLYLLDFDNSTGQITGFKTINTKVPAYTLLYSPDDSKLYFQNYQQIYQVDLDAADVEASVTSIVDEPRENFFDMQLGLDGRIYIAGRQQYDNYHMQYSLPVINCPNLAKYACNYDPHGYDLPLDHQYSNFPRFINDYIQQPKAARVTEFSLGHDTAICFGSFKLSAPEGWHQYKWNTGETAREITVTTPGVYYVLAGDLGFSCPSAFGAITISNAAAPLNLGKDTLLCPNLTYTLKLPPNYTDPLWSDGTNDIEKLVTTSSRFSVIAKDEKGCTNWDTITVVFKSNPVAAFGKDTTLCENQSLLLQLQPAINVFGRAQSYGWQDGSVKDTFRVKTPGVYWGTVTNDGCTVSDTIKVGFVSRQGVNLGADTTICNGDSLALRVSMPGAQYSWSTGETSDAIIARTGGTYWVSVNNGICTVTDTIKIKTEPRPLVSLGRDTVLCDQQKLVLSPAVSNAIYNWQDGTHASAFTVASAGTYWVSARVNGCSAGDTVVVNYKPLPVVSLGPDARICEGSSIVLKALNSDIQTYIWSTGSGQDQIAVANAGTYWVKVQGVNGCVNSDTVNVAVTPLPVFSLGRDTVLCEGSSLKLQYSLPGANYRWNDGNSAGSFSIQQPGLYWLDVTQNGCTKRDSLQVAYKPLPQVALGRDTTLCEGSQELLDATNPNASYSWQDGSSSPKFQVTKPGVYSVVVDMNGCRANGRITVSYQYKPRFSLGRDTSICEGMELVLDPHVSNASLLWQDGSTGAVFVVKNPGVYSLVASNGCGSTSDDIQVERGVCQLLMPTAFTPNGDGRNDRFKVKYPGFIGSFSMIVYDRWGGTVFRTRDALNGWDGTFKGRELPPGAYIWQISLTTKQGEKLSSKGTVMLMR